MSETKKKLYREGKIIPYWLGKKRDEETIIKVSEANRGKHRSEAEKQNLREHRLGKKHTINQLEKLKLNAKFNPNYGMKGKYHKIESKQKMSLARINKYTGKDNSAWLGGKSFEPYSSDFNTQFKEAIKQRDNLSCLKCGLFEEDARKIYTKGLHIHHIDYNKLNTIKENCCALCMRCNVEVNKNRPHWTKFFQSLLSERYGYQYSENSEIILKLNNQDFVRHL